LKVRNLVSRPYIEMTLNTLKVFGVEIEEIEKDCFRINGKKLTSCEYKIEADWSSASYWLVAAALGQNLIIQNLNLTSLQADKTLLLALEKANCQVIYSERGIQIDGTNRKAFDFDATDCPDLFPALVVLAAGIDGLTKISGIHRLEHKESNRALTLQSEFGKLGLKIELIANEMWIHGTGKLSGGKVDSHNDHRIAMSLGIASCITDVAIEIHGAEAVGKSYPSFWEVLESISF
jgi:3-phosphoshikimate 1-carboxyvinyltransferase